MPFVEVAGLWLSYQECGSRNLGLPLVFVHGAGTSSVTWHGILPRVGRTRRCLALDLPGHGQSVLAPHKGLWPQGHEASAPFIAESLQSPRLGTRPSGQQYEASASLAHKQPMSLDPETVPISIEWYADILLGFLTAVGLDAVGLVGHSMGGAIVIEATLRGQKQIQALALLATSARLGVGPALFETIDMRFEEFPEFLAGMAFGPDFPPKEAIRLVRLGMQASKDVVRADFEACRRFDARDRIRTIRVPTLVVLGEEDRLVPPKHTRFLAEGIPEATLLSLPQTGHMVHLEQPGTVAQALSLFALHPALPQKPLSA